MFLHTSHFGNNRIIHQFTEVKPVETHQTATPKIPPKM